MKIHLFEPAMNVLVKEKCQYVTKRNQYTKSWKTKVYSKKQIILISTILCSYLYFRIEQYYVPILLDVYI